MNSVERIVTEVVRSLAKQLARVYKAEGGVAGYGFQPVIRPKGDFYGSRSEPKSRGKVVVMPLHGKFRFDAFIQFLPPSSWEAVYRVYVFHGLSEGADIVESKRFIASWMARNWLEKKYTKELRFTKQLIYGGRKIRHHGL